MVKEIMLVGGPARVGLFVGNFINFQPQGGSEPVVFKIGSITTSKDGRVHLLGKIRPGTPEEKNCEVYYNPDRHGFLCGMIFNIKPTLTATN